MLAENKSPIDVDDKERASKMLEIVCNMYKCKYAILLTQFSEDPKTRSTVLINVQSIIRDWVSMCGEDCIFDDITDEEITARILEVVVHYRRFFEDKVHCKKSWVFMYYSDTISIDGLFKTQLVSDQKLLKTINTSIDMVRNISKFIPGLYMIKDGNNFVNLSILPYYITHELTSTSDKEKLHIPHTVLVVSGNDIDFISLGLLDMNGNFKIYGYKRKHPIIFSNNDILNKLIFPHRKINLKSLPMYISAYPILMLTQIHSLSEFKNVFDFKSIPSFEVIRKLVMKEFNKLLTSSTDCYDELVSSITSCESIINTNEMVAKVYNHINIPNVMKTVYSEIKSSMVWQKVDMIDYSIEELNDKYFLHYKIDFKALF